MSQDPYTRKYDMDILREVAADESGLNVIALVDKADDEIKELANWTIEVDAKDQAIDNDFELALLYVIFAQALAMKKSIRLGITPDNPSPTGRINRVIPSRIDFFIAIRLGITPDNPSPTGRINRVVKG